MPAGSSPRRWYSRSSRPTAVASVFPGRPAAGAQPLGGSTARLNWAAQLAELPAVRPSTLARACSTSRARPSM
ncbi:MAG: hypothetical protein ACRDRJ_20870, partial [Streptosporangiaceae bacterium]